MDHTLHCNSFFYWGIYRSFNDRLERQLQIITSSANPSKTNFGPQDPNKVSSAIDTWGHQSRFTSYIYSSADICLLTIQVLANALILFVFKVFCLPVPANIKCFMGKICSLWIYLSCQQNDSKLSECKLAWCERPTPLSPNSVFCATTFIMIIMAPVFFCILCNCILCYCIMMIMPQWDRREDCRWRLKCFQSKYCPYSPFAELKQ